MRSAASSARKPHQTGLRARIGRTVDTTPALWLAAVLAIACTVAYFGQLHRTPSGDTYGSVYTAVALVERQTFWLDHYLPFIQARSGEKPYMLARTADGHVVNRTPAAPSIQALPAFALFAIAGARAGDWDAWMEAAFLTAAITAALSVAVLFLLLTRITTQRRALLCAVVYAFCTLNWTVAGQALWQHSGAMLALSVALLALVDRRLVLAGAALAAMVAFRPSAPLIVVCLLPLVGRHPGAWLRLVAGALPVAVALGVFNTIVWGGPLRQGYTIGGQPGGEQTFGGSLLDGLGGLLVSPGRGLVWYSPVLVLGVVGAFVGWRTPLVRWSAVAAAAYLLAMARFIDWWGGETFGPRLLIETFPLLIVLLAAAVDRFATARWFRWTFGITAAWAFAVQLLAASSWPPPTWFDTHDLFARGTWWSFTDNELAQLVVKTPDLGAHLMQMLAIVLVGALGAAGAVQIARGRHPLGIAPQQLDASSPANAVTESGRIRVGRPVTLLVVAYVALFGAMAWPAQDDGWTQNAHYALVRSLADGTPQIDRYHEETGDASYWQGHYYSVKAPGVALAALPAYVGLRAIGVWPESHRTALWLLTLISSVIPALLLVWIVGRVADTLEPGSGLAVGLALAVATIVLPLSTVVFSHIWSALLAFGSFAILLQERRGRSRLALVAAAGLLSGLGVLFEYPTAEVGLILGVLAIARASWLTRGLAYTGGVLLGVAPLLAYNWWAFGSPFHLSYVNAIVKVGDSGHDVIGAHSNGVFGITWPSLRTLAELLLENRGLLTTTPVVAAGVAGLVLLIRAGRESAAAWTALATCIVFPLYNAGVTTTFGGAFGGDSPGPRYLVTALPFALVALGITYRRSPSPVLALAAISGVSMAVATITTPLVSSEEVQLWWNGPVTHTVAWLIGWKSTGLAPATPFLIFLGVVMVIASRELLALRRPSWSELPATVAAVAAWAAVILLVRPIVLDQPSAMAGAAALTALVLAVVLVLLAFRRWPTEPHEPDDAPPGPSSLLPPSTPVRSA
jgi:hypothetical protein